MKKRIFVIILMCFSIVFVSCSKSNSSGDGNYYPIEGKGMLQYEGDKNSETYQYIDQNDFIPTEVLDSQAFSLKVDTAAYTNVKRYIENEDLPSKDAVRTEELINYFNYDMEMPENKEHPFSIYTQTAKSPYDPEKYLSYIRIKTPDIDKSDMPPCNLTFLIDTSGSMLSYDKLSLLQQAFSLLVENLTKNDVVSIVTYAGSSEVVLDSVEGSRKEEILDAINSLEAKGSTAGAEGIQTAYELANKNYNKNYNNRVILASDGDFNVGISNTDELKVFISEKRDEGVYLSILGFGTGNLRDDVMETLAANGNGNYSYIDSLMTAQKVLVDEMGANLFVVAEDVKAQLKFNNEYVKEFRLVGYENRQMTSDDFDDENKDAGEIGAGTDIVVLVELILKEGYSEDLFEVCLRYKTPEKEEQKELIVSSGEFVEEPDSDFNFACAVAGFCEILRGSEYNGSMSVEDILKLAQNNLGKDEKGYRIQFIDLINSYIKIAG